MSIHNLPKLTAAERTPKGVKLTSVLGEKTIELEYGTKGNYVDGRAGYSIGQYLDKENEKELVFFFKNEAGEGSAVKVYCDDRALIASLIRPPAPVRPEQPRCGR